MFTGVTTYSNSTAFLKGGDYRDKNFCKNGEIDYYPFGMLMPNRYGDDGEVYRYAFNGKEQDPETMGQGNIYDYGFRIYNPRIAKFLSVDPLTATFPYYSPYQFAGNKPIAAIDLEGKEEYVVTKTYARDAQGNVSLHVDFRYLRVKQRTTLEELGLSPLSLNRKADVYVNGSYVRSEMNSFDDNTIEQAWEVHQELVYANIGDARRAMWQDEGISQSTNRPQQVCRTLKQSVEGYARGGMFGMITRMFRNGRVEQFNGLVDDFTFNADEINFGTNEYELNPNNESQIDVMARNLMEHSELTVNITGQTSMDGGEGYNQELSEKRVNSVKTALTAKLKANGMSDADIERRVTTNAIGRSQAQSEGDTENSDDSNNRKVTVTYDFQN